MTRMWLPLGLVGLAAGLCAVSLLGPLAFDVIHYRVTETLRNQTIGLDLVSLALVVPLALLSAFLVARGRALGHALTLGIGAYTAYMFVQYVLGPDYGHLPGDNERLFPLDLLLFVLGWSVALRAWNAVGAGTLPLAEPRARLLGRWLLPVFALFAFGRYLPAIADWMSSRPTDRSYLAGPAFSWAIALLDLGVFLPLTVCACVGVARGAPWARKAVYATVTWFGLVGAAVAAMAITMAVNHDPAGSTGNTVFLCVLGSAFVSLAVFLYLPLVRREAER